MARSLRSDIVNRIESEMEGAGEKEVAVEDATNHRTEEVTTDNTTGDTGTSQRRRFSTRSQATARKTAEVALLTGIRAMELDEVEGNIGIHLVLTEQLLGILEKEHLEYVHKEGLDINIDPEKSYMKYYEDKVKRAVDKHKARFVVLGEGGNAEASNAVPTIDTVERQLAQWDSASSMYSSTSKSSRGPTLLLKLKHKRAKIQAKAQAVNNVLSHGEIKDNPKSLTRAAVAWTKVEVLRCEYEAIMDEAYEVMGESEELKQGADEDTKQIDWLMGIETKLEEMLLLRESPEKKSESQAGGAASLLGPPLSHNRTKEFLSVEPKASASAANKGFTANATGDAPGDVSTGDLNASLNQSRFISLQAATNLENERRLLEQKAISDKLQQQLDSMRQGGGMTRSVTDNKAALRLPTCPPPKFDGLNLNYLNWKRLWTTTMGEGYKEEVQLMQLKTAIPNRTADLIGLSEIRTMENFWKLMDREYLDYNALSRTAIQDVKNLNRKDPRFLQMMKVKLETHSANLELSGMGYRITSDDMVRESWIPLLTEMAREDWLKTPGREAPLWPHFLQFLETQAQACRERERLGLALSTGQDQQGSTYCTRCKTRTHETAECKAQFCLECKTWGKCKIKSHRKQRQQPQERGGEDSHCPWCNESHPFGKHTRSRADSRQNDPYVKGGGANHKSHMQSGSTCRRCSKEIKDSSVVCGACGQASKQGETLHCYDHCLDFINAAPDERLRQVQRHGDCTICLLRDHDTNGHLARAASKAEKLQTCNLYSKQTQILCSSIQNASFHGAEGHKDMVNKNFHIRSHYPSDSRVMRDTGRASIRSGWEKSARKTRSEEMEMANNILKQPEQDGDSILLLVQEVELVHGVNRRKRTTSIFFDNGSTCSMIKRALVEALKLETVRRTIVVHSFRHVEALDTEYVVIELLQVDGTVAPVRAYVVDTITSMAAVEIPEDIKYEFNERTPWPERRVTGEVDILLGWEEMALHPRDVEVVGNLGVFKTRLSPDPILGGRHNRIKPGESSLSQGCQMLRQATAPPVQKTFRVKQMDHLFQLGDEMGNYIPKSCSNCRKCTTCTFAGSSITQKERIQLEYIERGIEHREEENIFKIKYPFLEDPREALTDNRSQAIAYGLSLEKKLDKHDLRGRFDEEFAKFIETKSLREIGQAEMRAWEGPVHYVPLQLVVNPDSQSTPFRIVTNTSCKDPKTKKSLNDILAKGPNLLSDPYKIMLRFRNRKFAISTDITKAYHGLRTGKPEMHLRRVVYRKPGETEWKTYGFLCVSFGDICAQSILECCLKKIAKMGKSMDLIAAVMVELDRFVDDLPSGHDLKEVIQKLRGEILENWQTTGTLAALFARGGFILKVIACSGDKDGPMVQKLGGAVLGIKWNTETDKFTIPLTVNISRRRRGEVTGPDLLQSTLDTMEGAVFTRRILLSVTMSLYDPLGFISPITIRLKWLLQQLGSGKEKPGWDAPIEKAEKLRWETLFRKMVETGEISFSRACKPSDVDLDAAAILITYMDGSDAAKAFVAYIRYMLLSGKAHVSLLASKSKLNPSGGQSTPRSEMDGHTLGARGARTIAAALDEVTPRIKKIYMLGDSRTILQALKSEATPFSEFFANRIGEIYDCIRDIPEDIEVIWGWVRSSDNGADIASRVTASPEELGENSVWQNGPEYLLLPEENWPIKTDVMTGALELPPEELRKQYKHLSFAVKSQKVTEEVRHELDEIASKTNCWKTALRKTRFLTRWFEKVRTKKFLEMRSRGWLTTLQLEQHLSEMANKLAVKYWLRHAGKETMKMVNKGKLKNMVIELKDGIPMVQTRFKRKSHHFFGAQELPLILASTEMGYMVCLDAHNQTHRGGDMALTMTKAVAFVVGAKKILQSIRRKCMICRREQAAPLRQRMGDMPEELQEVVGPFKKIALDLAGPFLMKADMRRRSERRDEGRIKVWVVCIVCSITSAVKLYLSRDYSEEGFLQVWSQHISDMGKPDLVYSDRGSQLVSAAGGLDPLEEDDEVDWQEIGMKTGVKWLFTPAQSQWRNGKSEAVVKSTKQSLRTTFKHVDLDFFEFITTLKEIAFILNSRPVELLLGSYSKSGGGQEEESSLPDSFTAITPNDLLIGAGFTGSLRSNYSPDTGPRRLENIKSKIDQWHTAFIDACQDRLFVRDHRWVEKTRNLRVGDVVWMIQDTKLSKKLKWGLVRTVFPDHDGVVRDCMVRYANLRPGPEAYITPFSRTNPFKVKLVSVQNLAVMYTKEEQLRDMALRERDPLSGSSNVDIVTRTDIDQEKDNTNTKVFMTACELTCKEGSESPEDVSLQLSNTVTCNQPQRVQIQEDMNSPEIVKEMSGYQYPERSLLLDGTTVTEPVLAVENSSLAQASTTVESISSGPQIFCQVLIPGELQPAEGSQTIMLGECGGKAQASTTLESFSSGPLMFSQDMVPEEIQPAESRREVAGRKAIHLIQASSSCTTIESGPLSFRQGMTESKAGPGLLAATAQTSPSADEERDTAPVEMEHLIQAGSKFLDTDAGPLTLRQTLVNSEVVLHDVGTTEVEEKEPKGETVNKQASNKNMREMDSGALTFRKVGETHQFLGYFRSCPGSSAQRGGGQMRMAAIMAKKGHVNYNSEIEAQHFADVYPQGALLHEAHREGHHLRVGVRHGGEQGLGGESGDGGHDDSQDVHSATALPDEDYAHKGRLDKPSLALHDSLHQGDCHRDTL